MSKAEMSIMIVDDARFSSAMINRVIGNAGYKDLRHASSAQDALRQLDERPVNILIADWLMPEMDGLELTQRVRQLDESINHFTYVILLTAKEGVDALAVAFDQGVDDFVNKSVMNDQLLPRLYAAERMSTMHNRLLIDNQQLIEANARLRKLSTHDALTGFGNREYAVKRLGDNLRHVASRGGAACYLLITINSFDALRRQYPPAIVSQVLVAVSRRLRQLIRPLDVATRIAPNQFAVIMHQPDISSCTAQNFRRLYDGVNLKAYKTSVGFISVKVSLTIAASDAQVRAPGAEALMDLAQAQVVRAVETGNIIVTHWDSTATLS
jgi:diguanylate cyclase (GGDEF)-like protein